MAATTTNQLRAHVHEAVDRIWMEGDLSYVDDHFAADYVLHDPSHPSDIEGPEGFKEYVKGYRSAFSDLEVTASDVIVEGERVALRYHVSGTHDGELMGIPPTGKTVEVSGMAMLRFENGKRKEDWFQDDVLGLLQQLGVVELPGE